MARKSPAYRRALAEVNAKICSHTADSYNLYKPYLNQRELTKRG